MTPQRANSGSDLVALITCCWCGFPRRCRLMPDVGWCCSSCWEAAEGIEIREAA